MNRFVKAALHVEEGSVGQRLLASTLGRLNPNNLVALAMTDKAYSDPTRDLLFRKKKNNLAKYKKDFNNLAKYDPEALKDTVISLGGGNFIDDYLYKKNRGEGDRWYQRLGGRVLQNSKTGPYGKLVGMLQAPYSFLADAGRASHYNPFADRAVLYQDEPAIGQHELGHALDFNKLYGANPGTSDQKGISGALVRQAKGVLRDAYMHSYTIPFVNLLHEGRANYLSSQALKATLSPEEYETQARRRTQVLPAGYGSYLGGNLGSLVGQRGVGALAGIGAGKIYGQLAAMRMPRGDNKKPSDPSSESTPTPELDEVGIPEPEKAVAKAAAFGAMMGKAALFGSKFTPDHKLQMDLIAEREKLVDDWYNGDMEDSATHPDMGGNPDFDRRWNKAFNEKEEVEPKAPPTPLYDSKPSWFPFRTQGMIDRARDAEDLRSDNDEAWDENDHKSLLSLGNDFTREGVNKRLNHWLDRNHGIIRNPYKTPADLQDQAGGAFDYEGTIDDSMPWRDTTMNNTLLDLGYEASESKYKKPANRQKLFDQYYPHLDMSPSAEPTNTAPVAKAAAFGAMMGKAAALLKRAEGAASLRPGYGGRY